MGRVCLLCVGTEEGEPVSLRAPCAHSQQGGADTCRNQNAGRRWTQPGLRLPSQRPGINPVAYLTAVEASIIYISESEGHIPDGRVALFNTITPTTSFMLLCYSLELCFYLEGTGWVSMGYGLLKGIQNIEEACPWSYSYRLDSSSYFLPHSIRLDIVTWPHLTVRETGKCHLAEAQEQKRQMTVGHFRSLVEPISSSSDEGKSHIFLPGTWLMFNPHKPILLIVVAISVRVKTDYQQTESQH